jgi:hypothetical protein
VATAVPSSYPRTTSVPLRAGIRRALATVTTAPARRRLRLTLAFIWLVDAALQYQPYMFTRAFVTQTIEPAAAGTPGWVEHPSLWAAHFMIHHIALYNTGFATIQLLIAVALVWRPTVRIGLAVSIVWALAIWWLAEGIGGITVGASAVVGAPGAVVLYAVIAVFVWPRSGEDETLPAATTAAVEGSVATSSPVGRVVANAAWSALWIGLALLGLERDNRSPSALASTVSGGASGEPGWIQTIDRGLATPLAHHGTEWSIGLAILFGLIALAVLVAAAVVVAAAIWLAEDFGGILTGSGTDVNSGPLLALMALAYWPVRRAVRADHPA